MNSISNKLDNLSQNDTDKFAKDFITEFMRNSFGALSSKEVEILVFRLFRDTGIIKEQDSHYTISRLLKIPQTRVKSLVLLIELRDSKFDEKYILHQLAILLEKASFIQDETTVSFGIEDPLVRADLEARLKNIGETPDYSFNKEILKININKLSKVLEDLLINTNKKDKLLDKIKKHNELKKFLGKTAKDTLSNILSTAAIPTIGVLLKQFIGL